MGTLNSPEPLLTPPALSPHLQDTEAPFLRLSQHHRALVGTGVEERPHPFRDVMKQQETAFLVGELGDCVLSPRDTASSHQLTMH